MDMIGWLVAFVILIGIEAATMALTTIWFAGGAVFAFFAAVLEFSVQTQLVVFLIVSFVLLLFTRPLAIRFVNRETVKTNVDGLIGRKAKVIKKSTTTSRPEPLSSTARSGRRDPRMKR